MNSDIVVIPRLTKLKIAEDSTEQPMDAAELAAAIKETHPHVVQIDDDAALTDLLKTIVQKGDVIAFLGSHGFRGMIEETIAKIKK
jgi:UDP-N-acetylmuramate-alanine ligase